MRQIVLNKKTGFKITNPMIPVIIRDFRGKLFYSTEPRIPRVKVFNLPKGKYYIDRGSFQPLKNPIKFKLPKLPKRQRHNKPFPSYFKFIFADNPNKCTIFWDRELIVCDPSLKEASLPVLHFILFHEFAHSRYGTEKYADAGSAYMMIKKGYNPWQIVKSPLTSLSNNQLDRKIYIYNLLLNSRYES